MQNKLEDLSPALRSAHSELSEHSFGFVDFAHRNPACLTRSAFPLLAKIEQVLRIKPQPWPTFVSHQATAEMARVNTTTYQFLIDLPQRVCGGDIDKVSESYQLPRAEVATALGSYRKGSAALFGRGDYINTRQGLKCLEFNFSTSIGGWESLFQEKVYLGTPMIKEFLERRHLRARCRPSLEIAFDQIIDDALSREDFSREGEINLAILVPVELSSLNPIYVQTIVRCYASRIGKKDQSLTGEAFLCDADQLASKDQFLWAENGKRAHVLLNQNLLSWDVPEKARTAFEAGTLNLYNNPYQRLLRNKLGLALLSEQGESSLFSEEERRFIKNHIPWTRRITKGATRYQGEEVSFAELLQRHRSSFVLKPAYGYGGSGVTIGRHVSTGQWEEALGQALEQGTWSAQECVDSLPYLYQVGEDACAEHDVVWGLLSFGPAYGGGFVRMLPKGKEGNGLVNASQGATEGPIFEVAGAADQEEVPIPS